VISFNSTRQWRKFDEKSSKAIHVTSRVKAPDSSFCMVESKRNFIRGAPCFLLLIKTSAQGKVNKRIQGGSSHKYLADTTSFDDITTCDFMGIPYLNFLFHSFDLSPGLASGWHWHGLQNLRRASFSIVFLKKIPIPMDFDFFLENLTPINSYKTIF